MKEVDDNTAPNRSVSTYMAVMRKTLCRWQSLVTSINITLCNFDDVDSFNQLSIFTPRHDTDEVFFTRKYKRLPFRMKYDQFRSGCTDILDVH